MLTWLTWRVLRRPHLKGDYGRGFLTRGLFAYSRHPNFFAEQSMWWAFYLVAVAAKGGPAAGQDAWLQPVLVGPVLLSLLFQGSTPFTEDITLRKYPGAPGCAAGRRWLSHSRPTCNHACILVREAVYATPVR